MTNAQSAIEEWRDIPGTDGMYQISSFGNVRSRAKATWRFLKLRKNSQGYNRVRLSVPERKQPLVHRLVAEAFIPNHDNLPIVNHKDFNPLNCRADNLEWTTLQGNYDYSAKRGRFVRTAVWKDRLTKTMRSTMGKPIIGTPLNGGSEIVLSSLNQCREYGFQPSCVCNCCKGKRRQTGGYTWRYADEKNLKQAR